MRELRRTNNLVYLNYALAMLRAAGFRPVVLDDHTSDAFGSASVFQRRIMAPAEEASAARALLDELDRQHGEP